MGGIRKSENENVNLAPYFFRGGAPVRLLVIMH